MADHYYSAKQESAYNPFLIKVRPRGQEFELYSASGVFSIKHLDKGTEVMLKYAEVPTEGKILDLGCGYGVVGVTLLRENPKLDLVSVDSSTRAVKLTKKNLEFHNLKAIVKVSDVLSKVEDNDFDAVYTNPPYAAGRAVCFKFVEEAFEHVKIGGNLQVVCRRQKGGDVLEKKMKEVFGNVSVIGQKSGFRLYKSIKG